MLVRVGVGALTNAASLIKLLGHAIKGMGTLLKKYYFMMEMEGEHSYQCYSHLSYSYGMQ